MILNDIDNFERICREAVRYATIDSTTAPSVHPFEVREVHFVLPIVVRKLFDNGHYSQATFEAFKFLDKEVSRLSGESETGFKLMMKAFSEDSPLIALTACKTVEEKDEQHGYRFIFAGSSLAIRNPRGHLYSLINSPDECLDHLSLASLLLRRIETAGFTLLKP